MQVVEVMRRVIVEGWVIGRAIAGSSPLTRGRFYR